jgi:phosphatidylglycerophosphatase A
VTRLQVVLSTWFGCGFAPIIPGTFGTLGSVPLVLLLWWAGSWPLHLVAIPVVTAVGLWAAKDAEKKWGRKDPGKVVIDETAGYLVATFLIAPAAPTAAAWAVPLAGSFVLFRAMDILKPWPARRLEALPGSVGIMVDDLFAGLYANVLLQGVLWYMRRRGIA